MVEGVSPVAKSAPLKTTIVVFSGDFDKAFATFNIANGAAASGHEVTLFFCLWGTLLLKKRGDRFKGPNILSRMFSVMRPGGPAGISRMDMGRMGRWMMKKLLRDSGAATLEELMQSARDLGVRFIVCDLSLGVLGIKEDQLRWVDTVAGAGTYIAEASESQVTLFI